MCPHAAADRSNRARASNATLLVSCPDRPGVVAAVAQFLFDHGANILDADQHTTDPFGGTFFMRMVFQLDGLDLGREQLERAFERAVAERFEMRWRVSYADRPKRMAILASRVEHCLLELLWRHRAGEFEADIALVVSNHDTLGAVVEPFGVPFHHVPKGGRGREEHEADVLALLEGQADVIVLARYMQILSPSFVARYPARILNIHHSFLPAFVGADPYGRAHRRGVKLIGATAHYVTDDLDEGPIIEQDVVRVSHRESRAELVRLGREIERRVLARAVRAHLEDRILVFDNKTVVFG